MASSSAQPPDPTRIPEDAIDLSTLPNHALRVPPITDSRELMSVSPPVLERPVLMVHGLAQHADTFVSFKTHLCSRTENPWGGVYRASDEQQFLDNLGQDSQAKVFAVDISDNLAAPRVVANEVRRAITAIMEATGASEVDVITHSMGSLVTRESIRQGEDSIANLLMISPPNQGAYEATAATLLGDSGVYEHYPQAKLGAMDALRLEYGPGGGVRNQWLHELNEFWRQDADRPRASVVTGIGIPTPDRSLKAVAPGDGMVAARRAPLEGAEFHLAVPNQLEAAHPHFRDFQEFRYNHLQIVSEPEIFRNAGQFLSNGQSLTRTQESFEQALDRVEAANREFRREIDQAEQVRQGHQSKQLWATRMAGAGAVATLAGLATSSIPWVSTPLLVAGGLGFAGGSLYAYRHSKAMAADSKNTVDSAERSLNLADSLVQRYRREIDHDVRRVSTDLIRDFSDRTAAKRDHVVTSDWGRRHHGRWMTRGMSLAAAGTAVAGLGAATRRILPTAGAVGMTIGALTLGAGILTALIHSSRLEGPVQEATQVSREALALSDQLVEEFRQNPQPTTAPTTNRN